jgi:hypothetical protein
MFCDVCLVGLWFTVGIFSPPPIPYSTYLFNSRFVYIVSRIACPSPFATLVSTQGFCLVPSWCPIWLCRRASSCERYLCLVDLFSCFFTCMDKAFCLSILHAGQSIHFVLTKHSDNLFNMQGQSNQFIYLTCRDKRSDYLSDIQGQSIW